MLEPGHFCERITKIPKDSFVKQSFRKRTSQKRLRNPERILKKTLICFKTELCFKVVSIENSKRFFLALEFGAVYRCDEQCVVFLACFN